MKHELAEMKLNKEFKMTTRDLVIDREVANERNKRPITLHIVPQLKWDPHIPTFSVQKGKILNNSEISGKTYRATPNIVGVQDQEKNEALKKIYNPTGRTDENKIPDILLEDDEIITSDLVQSTSDRCRAGDDNVKKEII